jgi:hypothetical protein
MNTRRRLGLVAAFAWAGVALSSAAPASAVAIFNAQYGAYATCAQDYTAYSGDACGYDYNYYQRIKIVTNGCNSGACASDSYAFVDFLYGAGRKTTSFLASCGDYNPYVDMTMNAYGLGTCAC